MTLTIRGAAHFLSRARGVANPASYKLMLITSAVAPTRTTQTFSGLTEIAAGNGYSSGGITLNLDTTDFDQLVEDVTTNYRAELHLKDIDVAASGGAIPASGSGIATMVLTDDNATLANRQVFAFWTATNAPITIASGQTYRWPDPTIVIACSAN